MVKEYGYEYDAVLDQALYERVKEKAAGERMNGAICLRSGRDALKVVARTFRPTLALLPALACDSMILPFEMYGHHIQYYKLNRDYSIQLDSLCSLLPNAEDEVLFLYMDYFGHRAIADAALEKLRADYPKLVLIEDRTHNLLIESKYSFKPDFVVASLRKWLSVPDGGLLWTEREMNTSVISRDMSFARTRLEAQLMRHEFLQTGNEELKARYRRIFSTVTDMIDEDPLPGSMSQYSYELAKKADLRRIRDIRAQNAKILIDELDGFEFVQDQPGTGDVYVAVLIDNRDAVQRRLASMGIFCTIIWPLNDRQRVACEVARATEARMLTIYCDQRYSEADMKYVAYWIKKVCNE